VFRLRAMVGRAARAGQIGRAVRAAAVCEIQDTRNRSGFGLMARAEFGELFRREARTAASSATARCRTSRSRKATVAVRAATSSPSTSAMRRSMQHRTSMVRQGGAGGRFVLALRSDPDDRWLIAADLDNSGPPPAR